MPRGEWHDNKIYDRLLTNSVAVLGGPDAIVFDRFRKLCSDKLPQLIFWEMYATSNGGLFWFGDPH